MTLAPDTPFTKTQLRALRAYVEDREASGKPLKVGAWTIRKLLLTLARGCHADES